MNHKRTRLSDKHFGNNFLESKHVDRTIERTLSTFPFALKVLFVRILFNYYMYIGNICEEIEKWQETERIVIGELPIEKVVVLGGVMSSYSSCDKEIKTHMGKAKLMLYSKYCSGYGRAMAVASSPSSGYISP